MFTTVDKKRRDRKAAMHTRGAALAPEHSRGGCAREPQLRRVCPDVLCSLCKVLYTFHQCFTSVHWHSLRCTESSIASTLHLCILYVPVDLGGVVRAARAAARVRTAAGAATGARAQCSATRAARRPSPRRARARRHSPPSLVHIHTHM